MTYDDIIFHTENIEKALHRVLLPLLGQPRESVLTTIQLAVRTFGESERGERHANHHCFAQKILQLKLGAVNFKRQAGLPDAAHNDSANGHTDQRQIDQPGHGQF